MYFYKRHIGDYVKDTVHLTLLEHGIYSRLLDVYYTREAAIPQATAARLIGARTKEETAATLTVLEEFFNLVDGEWHHKRCDVEIAASLAKAEKNREQGKKGGRPQKIKTDSVSELEPINNPDGYFSGQENEFREPRNNPSHKPVTSNHKPETQAAPQVSNTVGAAASKSFEPQKPAEIPPDPSPTALPATPLPDTSHNPSMAGLIAGDLRRRRVLVTSQNPTLLAWIRDGIFLPQLVEAVEIARLRLGEECEIKAGYIDAIARDPKAGKAAEPVDRWWDSQQSIDRKAREVGVRATGSDTYDTLKDKIFAKIKTLKTDARQAA